MSNYNNVRSNLSYLQLSKYTSFPGWYRNGGFILQKCENKAVTISNISKHKHQFPIMTLKLVGKGKKVTGQLLLKSNKKAFS